MNQQLDCKDRQVISYFISKMSTFFSIIYLCNLLTSLLPFFPWWVDFEQGYDSLDPSHSLSSYILAFLQTDLRLSEVLQAKGLSKVLE